MTSQMSIRLIKKDVSDIISENKTIYVYYIVYLILFNQYSKIHIHTELLFRKKKKKEEEKTPGKIAKNTNTRILEKEMKVKYVFLNHLN